MKLTDRMEWNKELGGAKTAIGNGRILAVFDGPDLIGLRMTGYGSPSLLKLHLTGLPVFESFVTTHPTANALEHSMFQKIDPGMESMYLTERTQLRIADYLDSRHSMLIRTMASRISEFSFRIETEPNVRMFYYVHDGPAYANLACLLLIFPENGIGGAGERRLYLFMTGKTEWNEEQQTIRFFAPGGKLIAAVGDPNSLARRVLAHGRQDDAAELFMGSLSAAVDSDDAIHWSRYYRRCSLFRSRLRNRTEERIVRIVYETLAALYSRRIPCGLYATGDSARWTTVREQYHAALFLLAAGYKREVTELLGTVFAEMQRRNGISRELPLGGEMQAVQSGYEPYDTALFLLRLIGISAELIEDRELLGKCVRAVLRCCELLQNGITGLMVPYSGCEPELAERPFDSRFRGSACATMAYMVCIRRLQKLAEDGSLPLDDSLKCSVDLAASMERSFCQNFMENGTLLADKKAVRSKRPRYAYGDCPMCGMLNKKPYEGWLLLFRSGIYICPDCFQKREKLQGKRVRLPAGRQSALPLLYAACWDFPCLQPGEMKLALQRLANCSQELTAAENAILLHVLRGKDPETVSVCLRNLVFRTEREQWETDTLDDRLLSAAMLTEYLSGNPLAF